MKDYKTPEIEKIEYKSEDVLTISNEDNVTVGDINDILNTPTPTEQAKAVHHSKSSFNKKIRDK